MNIYSNRNKKQIKWYMRKSDTKDGSKEGIEEQRRHKAQRKQRAKWKK